MFRAPSDSKRSLKTFAIWFFPRPWISFTPLMLDVNLCKPKLITKACGLWVPDPVMVSNAQQSLYPWLMPIFNLRKYKNNLGAKVCMSCENKVCMSGRNLIVTKHVHQTSALLFGWLISPHVDPRLFCHHWDELYRNATSERHKTPTTGLTLQLFGCVVAFCPCEIFFWDGKCSKKRIIIFAKIFDKKLKVFGLNKQQNITHRPEVCNFQKSDLLFPGNKDFPMMIQRIGWFPKT